jgi:hypothetical protein
MLFLPDDKEKRRLPFRRVPDNIKVRMWLLFIKHVSFTYETLHGVRIPVPAYA